MSEGNISRKSFSNRGSFVISDSGSSIDPKNDSRGIPDTAPLQYNLSKFNQILRSIRLYTVLMTLILVSVPTLIVSIVWAVGFYSTGTRMINSMRNVAYRNTFEAAAMNNKRMSIVFLPYI